MEDREAPISGWNKCIFFRAETETPVEAEQAKRAFD